MGSSSDMVPIFLSLYNQHFENLVQGMDELDARLEQSNHYMAYGRLLHCICHGCGGWGHSIN